MNVNWLIFDQILIKMNETICRYLSRITRPVLSVVGEKNVRVVLENNLAIEAL